ncbi:MAG: DNA-directed RNA polymerase subunit omega [Candidatus Marinimicrobia bacterium]|nr:DNA-directed RNA polymerase subunit omega [Candidatus Neomarinimicrobiota bacterium]MDD5581799.1 DNA-directed RNA polymerase subunit omega [Candidatus Neomarinimicrobiota bacterium]
MSKEGFKYEGERPDDIFEAIIVMAKRARQINQRRADKFTLRPYQISEDEEEIEQESLYEGFDFDSLEKPTTMAMRQYAHHEIEYEYSEGDEEFDSNDEEANNDMDEHLI